MKPILFNTNMVRAILEDRKTMTRRAVKLKYSNTHLEKFTSKCGTRLIEKQNEEPGVTTIKNPDRTTTHTLLAYIEKTPPYRPGDILYVREAFCLFDADHVNNGVKYAYKADATPESERARKDFGYKWRPSIHMPREAARIFLRVTDVQVERLRSISDTQCMAEGVACPWNVDLPDAFAELWDSTIKPADRTLYGWAANPWVWIISFERISREEAAP